MNESIETLGTTRRRRNMLLGGTTALAALGLSQMAGAAETERAKKWLGRGTKSLPNLTNELVMKDGTTIFYKDWGSGQPITFSHGWPLTADAWDAQMVYLGERGYRVIAHDRRGHGRSAQTWSGNDMDTYADDLAAVMNHLDLKNTMMVGHSTGGGEVVRYLGRHGSKRVSKIVLVGAIPPQMVKTATNPNGAPMEIFDGLRSGVRSDRSEFFKGLSAPFFGANLPGAKPWQGLRDSFWLQGMMGGQKSLLDCIKAFSETDFHEDLKNLDVPTLLIHGESDQIVPIQISSDLMVKLIKGARLKVYPGAPHGLTLTHQDTFNQDLLEFLKA